MAFLYSFINGIVINISKIADKKKARQLVITSIFKPIMPYNIPPSTGATILDNACTPFTIPFACSNFFSELIAEYSPLQLVRTLH